MWLAPIMLHVRVEKHHGILQALITQPLEKRLPLDMEEDSKKCGEKMRVQMAQG